MFHATTPGASRPGRLSLAFAGLGLWLGGGLSAQGGAPKDVSGSVAIPDAAGVAPRFWIEPFLDQAPPVTEAALPGSGDAPCNEVNYGHSHPIVVHSRFPSANRWSKRVLPPLWDASEVILFVDTNL
jgi:hypothetical protein